ncbi:hypothetical protein EVG20_g3487 [Dentipellis fragilis]|uniref:Yeast cell wall synthesis Kre9/Knh1-like N-terminal domain-containing protein n=1 Tax=Dentipellis fragilis TaxID=205917 RepID=A0A4Y9Z3Q8_9AGAM|nr:hypothetical protein EVG20_g3487 [Dentipellis fragilis]
MSGKLATGRYVSGSRVEDPPVAVNAFKVAITLLFAASLVACDFVPTSPGPGDAFVSGTDCVLKWDADASGLWKNMTIELMSGSNVNMSLVASVAKGVDGTNASVSPLSWPCPDVDPFSTIYFYQFSNADTKKWTTRFTRTQITSPNGSYTLPSESQQPNGDKIPWGVGRLVQEPNANQSSPLSRTACSNAHTNSTEQHKNATGPAMLVECKEESPSAESAMPSSTSSDTSSSKASGHATASSEESGATASHSAHHEKTASAQSSAAGASADAATASHVETSSQSATASLLPITSTSGCDERFAFRCRSQWLIPGAIVALLM